MTIPLDTKVEELEVSVKTSKVLDGLGAEDLAQLLALPEICGPKMVLMELQLLLADNGLSYAGQWVEQAGVEIAELTGDFDQRWKQITAWLTDNTETALEHFNPGATEAQIRKAEDLLGVSLPPAFRQFVAIHNGQVPDAPMVHTCSLLPLEGMVEQHRELNHLFAEPASCDPEDVDEGIRAVDYDPRWIPIGVSARGRDYLCLDMAPAEGGSEGQIILIAVDDFAHELVAAGFLEFLSVYYRELQEGEIEFAD